MHFDEWIGMLSEWVGKSITGRLMSRPVGQCAVGCLDSKLESVGENGGLMDPG